MKISLAVMVLIVSSACVVDSKVKVSAPVPTEGKRGAPVAIDAAISERTAKLTLTFERAASGVSVDVSGIDGLVLTSEGSLVKDANVKAGEPQSFELAYTRGAGRTNLVVNVRGTFDGAPLSRVVTFAIGDGPLTTTGTKVITNEGDSFKVMQVP